MKITVTENCRLNLLERYTDKFLGTIDHPTPYRNSLPCRIYFEVHQDMMDDMHVSSIKNESGEIVYRLTSSADFPSEAAILEYVANLVCEAEYFGDVAAMHQRMVGLGYRMYSFSTGCTRGEVSKTIISADPIDEITAAIQLRCPAEQIIDLIDELDDLELLMLEHVKFGSPYDVIKRFVRDDGMYSEVLAYMNAAGAYTPS